MADETVIPDWAQDAPDWAQETRSAETPEWAGTTAGEQIYSALTSPLLRLPRIAEQPESSAIVQAMLIGGLQKPATIDTAQKVIGAANAAIGMLEGATSPKNLAILAMGAINPAIPRSYFGAEYLVGLPSTVRETARAFAEGDNYAAGAGMFGVGSGAMLAVPMAKMAKGAPVMAPRRLTAEESAARAAYLENQERLEVFQRPETLAGIERMASGQPLQPINKIIERNLGIGRNPVTVAQTGKELVVNDILQKLENQRLWGEEGLNEWQQAAKDVFLELQRERYLASSKLPAGERPSSGTIILEGPEIEAVAERVVRRMNERASMPLLDRARIEEPGRALPEETGTATWMQLQQNPETPGFFKREEPPAAVPREVQLEGKPGESGAPSKTPAVSSGEFYSLPHPEAVARIGRAVWHTALDASRLAKQAGKPAAEIIKAGMDEIAKALPANAYDRMRLERNLDAAMLHGLYFNEPYATPRESLLAHAGGPVAKKVVEEGGLIRYNEGVYLGELDKVFDPAIRQFQNPFNPATHTLSGKTAFGDHGAVSNLRLELERYKAGGADAVSPSGAGYVSKVWDANLAAGQNLESVIPGFKANGAMQRIPTPEGVEVLLSVDSATKNRFIDNIAAAQINKQPLLSWAKSHKINSSDLDTIARIFVDRFRNEHSKLAWNSAAQFRVAQDFVRVLPYMPDYVRTVNGRWLEMFESNPVNYLRRVQEISAITRAFREVYPLDSGVLKSTYEAVANEIDTSKHPTLVDDYFRAMQRHGIPDYTAFAAYERNLRFLNEVPLPVVKALMLSQNFVTNLPETVRGQGAVYFGWPRELAATLRTATDYQAVYRQALREGAVNRFYRDFTLSSAHPARSASRFAANTIGRLTMNQVLNEFQEVRNALMARVIADEVVNGTIDVGTRERLVGTMQAMGFTRERAIRAANGGDTTSLNVFVRDFPAFASGGNVHPMIKSALGTSRGFNQLALFQGYTMSRMNQIRQNFNLLFEAMRDRDWAAGKEQLRVLGSNTGGVILTGAMGVGLLALLREGMSGVSIAANEAKDDWKGFALSAATRVLGAPMQVLHEAARRGEQGAIQAAMSWLTAGPNTVYDLMWQLPSGSGSYEGLTMPERINRFINRRTPALKAFKAGLAVAGLSGQDLQTQAAVSAFYRWKRDQGWEPGRPPATSGDDARFRVLMRKAEDAIINGRDWRAELARAFNMAGSDYNRLASVLEGKVLLEDTKGRSLSLEMMESLRKRIGPDAVAALERRDTLVREVARNLRAFESDRKQGRGMQTVLNLAEPSGRFYTDNYPARQRQERLLSNLSAEVQAAVGRLEITIPQIDGLLKLGSTERQLTVEEGHELEESLGHAYDTILRRMLSGGALENLSIARRNQYISQRLAPLETAAKLRIIRNHGPDN